MNHPARCGRAVLALLVLAWPLSASAGRARMSSRPRPAGAAPVLCAPGLTGPQLKPIPGALSAPLALPRPVPSWAAPPAAAVPASAPVGLSAGLTRQAHRFEQAQSQDPSGASGQRVLRGMYEGRTAAAAVLAEAPALTNDEGVAVFGRAARYYQEVRRIVERLRGRVDLGESLDVMDDAYADVWAKLKAIESVAKQRDVERHNTHLEDSLVWVDGVMRDKGRSVAIHTHRVFFHHSSNPRSEIEEGIRRVDRYLDDAVKNFAPKGKAERFLGRLDEVVLVFDTRGYEQIKSHLQARQRELAGASGQRYRFMYMDELAAAPGDPEALHQELNALTRTYRGQGLEKIMEGVIYSRYVGLLLELRTIEHYLDQGYRIVQSGRELFDRDGKYVTELDVVVRAPDGRISVVEAKSTRVPMPPEAVLREKVVAKLDAYTKHRSELESSIGGKFDAVEFSVDVGKQPALAAFLRGQEAALSQRYGFAVRFLFLGDGREKDLSGRGRRG